MLELSSNKHVELSLATLGKESALPQPGAGSAPDPAQDWGRACFRACSRLVQGLPQALSVCESNEQGLPQTGSGSAPDPDPDWGRVWVQTLTQSGADPGADPAPAWPRS